MIVYLRKQNYWFESMYAQFVKNGLYCRSIKSFIKENYDRGNYYELLNNYAQQFCKKNIVIKIYDYCSNNLIESFLDCLDIEKKIIEVKDNEKKNISLSKKTIKLMMMINVIFIQILRIDSNKITKYYRRYLQQNEKIVKLISLIPNFILSNSFLNNSDIIKILEKFKNSNESIARQFNVNI